MKRRRARNSESGYALLFVYLMAAVVAIMLYNELPSIAFEAQRSKEQLLIDRGEQYSRAILLYVRKNNRFPTDFDALDKTVGQRFLRRRYKDPMTGTDEWRLIHVGPGGIFTDSLLYNKKTDVNKDQQSFITELQPVGGAVADPNAQGGNLAARRRPSEVAGAPGNLSGGAPIPGTDPNGLQYGIPNGYNPTGQITNQSVQTLPNGQVVPVPDGTGQNGLPPGVQFPPGAQLPPGFGGQAPVQPNSSAANLINQILTTPRPGGLNGTAPQVDQFGNPLPAQQGGATTNGFGGTQPAPLQGQSFGGGIGGGIAGVASKLEREGIKIYKERTSYHEWEFVYDISKDKSRLGLGAPTPPTPGNTGGAPGAPLAPTGGGQVPGQAAGITNTQPQPVIPNPQPQFPIAQPTYQPSVPDPGANPVNPGVPGQPAFPINGGASGTPGTPPFPNPGQPFPNPVQPGGPVFPNPVDPGNSGGMIPSQPIGGGGMVPSAPIGGGPH